MVAKRMGEIETLSGQQSRDARKVRSGVVFCTPDGTCTQLVRDDGRVNVHTVYGATLALAHALAPEMLEYSPEQILGSGLFESGMVHEDVVLSCATAGAEFVSKLELADQLELGDKVAGVFRSHLLTQPPMVFSSALGRARDKHELYQFVARALPAAINPAMEARNMETEETQVEEEVLEQPEESAAETETTEEEVPEPGTVSLSRGELADTVDARLLSARFAEATWAMQDLVYGALFNDDLAVDERLTRADAIIDEFSGIAQSIIRDMVRAGYVPVSADELRMLSVQRVEMTAAAISRTRADRIEQVSLATVNALSDLLHLVRNAELPGEDGNEPDAAVEDNEAETEEQEQEAVVSSLIDERLTELAQSRREQADSLLQVLRGGGPLPAEPVGQVAQPAQTQEQVQVAEQSDMERRFLESLGGGRR